MNRISGIKINHLMYSLVVIYFLLLCGTAYAGQLQFDELSDMELEELLQQKIIPDSILGTHTHMKGEWMIGYEFMFMNMNESINGTEHVPDEDILMDYPVTPTAMDMQMHMVHLMYAPTNDLTLKVMLPYVEKSMSHLTLMDQTFTTKSSGVGDVKVGALYTIYRYKFDQHRIILKSDIGIPTGSINETDYLANPDMGKQRLPYPMQIGSGTFDLFPGISYVGIGNNLSWGADLNITVRLGKNKNNYALGNESQAALWLLYQANDWIAPFFKLEGRKWGNIKGADPLLNPLMVPTADPKLRGGTRLDLNFGLNIYFQNGILEGHRLGTNIKKPVYQSLDGPQLDTHWEFRLGWQWVF